MRNVSDRSCRENQNTTFMFNNVFPENRAAYEVMWKNMVEATETHSEYIIPFFHGNSGYANAP
jgi:hypothetical protein